MTIFWKAHLCVHAGKCAKGLPAVFQPKEKPWIKPEAATTQAIINQVNNCPSGALTFFQIQKNTTIDSNELIVNSEKKRFELHVQDKVAFMKFILNKDNILFLTHTEVPTALEGKGIGSKIVLLALQYTKEHHCTLAPLCPFVAKYLIKHPEWQSILANGYHIK